MDGIPGVTIERVAEADEALVAACRRLLPQISPANSPPTLEELVLLVTSPCVHLFVARLTEANAPNPTTAGSEYAAPEHLPSKAVQQSAQIIGLATLILYRVPTGLRAYIEDVVVDDGARRRRIGEALTWVCLEAARKAGAPYVGLTSNPTRLAANSLYQKMGFVRRKTNVYRYVFKEQSSA